MTEASRFLDIAALRLIREEGLRVVKAHRAAQVVPGWSPGWDEWDQVLVGEGAGVQPSIFAFKNGSGLDFWSIRGAYDSLVRRVTATGSGGRVQGFNAGVRLIAVMYFEHVDAATARQITGMVPDRYYAGLRPQVWVADLARGKLWTPRRLRPIPSRAETAVRQVLAQFLEGVPPVAGLDLAEAEASAAAERADFVSTMRRNIPYVTYALLAACWIVFLLESSYGSGPGSSRTLLHFGALEPALVTRGEWWLLLTTMFVHVSVLHILFNSVALYSVGSLVERIYGAVRYTIIYFVSGILASLASYGFMEVSGQSGDIAAGASGAIFGIAGVVIVLGVLRQSVVPRAVALQLSVFMGVLIVVNIVFDAFTPQIDIRAHIGGLLVGLVLGYLLAPRARPKGARAAPLGEPEVTG